MKNVKLLVLITVLIFVGSLYAQEPVKIMKDQPKIEVKAEFRMVEVIVMEDDEHILDLKKNAFKVFENGNRQEIISVHEINLLDIDEDAGSFEDQIASKEGREEVQPNVYIFMIANVNFDKKRYLRLREGIAEFIEDNMKPIDKTAIFVAKDTGIKKVLDFTSDKKTILKYCNMLFDRPQVMAGNFAFTSSERQLQLMDLMNSFVSRIRDLPGRKNILFFSKGIPLITKMNDSLLSPGHEDGGSSSQDLRALHSASNKELQEKGKILLKTMSLAKCTLHAFDAETRMRRRRSGTEDGFAEAYVAAAADGNNPGFARPNTFSSSTSPTMINERLGMLEDLVSAGEGELFTRSLSSSGKLQENLEEVYNMNLHYYQITYRILNIEKTDVLSRVKIEVEHDDANKVIYKTYVAAPK